MAFATRRLGQTQTVVVSSCGGDSTLANIKTMSIIGLDMPKFSAATTVGVKVSQSSSGTFRPLLKSDLTGAWEYASTGNVSVFVPDVAPFQWAKVAVGGTTVSPAETFFIIGRG